MEDVGENLLQVWNKGEDKKNDLQKYLYGTDYYIIRQVKTFYQFYEINIIFLLFCFSTILTKN